MRTGFHIYGDLKEKISEGEVNLIMPALFSAIDFCLKSDRKSDVDLLMALILMVNDGHFLESYYKKDSDFERLFDYVKSLFELDPSVFEVTFFYGYLNKISGNEARASQLFTRLQHSGWVHKSLVCKFN